MHTGRYSYADSKSDLEAYVFLHGFPGQFTKNEDLAVSIASNVKADCYTPHFTGIGLSPGEFLFTRCISDARDFVEAIWMSGKYTKVNIIAHSWGAFVAIQLLQQLSFPVARLILLAPLTFIPPAELMKEEFEQFIKSQIAIGHPANLERLIDDHAKIQADFLPAVKTPDFQTWPKTLVIQGKADAVTPSALNGPYFTGKHEKVSYIEVEDNHWLTNRATVNDLILSFLRNA